MRYSAIWAAFAVLVLGTAALGQTQVPAAVGVPFPIGGGWGNWARASTVQEGAARGAADMIRAAGENNLLNSMAAQNYEAARSQNLDNRVKYAETFYAKRRMNEEYRSAKRTPPPTAEQLFRRAEAAKPRRLSPGEFDPVSGSISWPLLLQSDSFASDRATLEELFGEMAANERLSFDQLQQIREAGARMQEQLNSIIREVAPRDHMQATSFLNSLLFEARLVAG